MLLHSITIFPGCLTISGYVIFASTPMLKIHKNPCVCGDKLDRRMLYKILYMVDMGLDLYITYINVYKKGMTRLHFQF